MGNKTEIEHVGGWPKILNEIPEWPHDYMDPDSHDEADEPNHINMRLHRIFRDKKNAYAVFSSFIECHKLGLYPPRWALDHLVVCLEKHMRDPQPDLFASRMGVVGPVSGATSPRDRFNWHSREGAALHEMVFLRMAFEISLTDAARAAIEKYQLDVTPKRLTNQFRAENREMKEAWAVIKAREDYDPLHVFYPPTNETRDRYIGTFPRRAQNIIRKNMPAEK